MASLVGAFVGSTAVASIFHRSAFYQKNLKFLGLRGLYGVGLQVACLGFGVFNAVRFCSETKNNDERRKKSYKILFGTHILTGVVLSVVSKWAMNYFSYQMGTQEAFFHYAASSLSLPLFLFVDTKLF